MEAINKIRAEFILESMINGLSFEQSLEKSFNQVNEFFSNLSGSENFNKIVFNNVLEIVKKDE